jgi:hypothetical protein
MFRLGPYSLLGHNFSNALRKLPSHRFGRIGTRTGIFPWTFVEVLESSSEALPPPSLHTEDSDETGYRPDGPDSFGLPPDNNDDLYSANDGPTSSLYPPPLPPSRMDAINYGAEFQDFDLEHEVFNFDRTTDLQAALPGMGFEVSGNEGVEGGVDEVPISAAGGEVMVRGGRRKVEILETIEE